MLKSLVDFQECILEYICDVLNKLIPFLIRYRIAVLPNENTETVYRFICSPGGNGSPADVGALLTSFPLVLGSPLVMFIFCEIFTSSFLRKSLVDFWRSLLVLSDVVPDRKSDLFNKFCMVLDSRANCIVLRRRRNAFSISMEPKLFPITSGHATPIVIVDRLDLLQHFLILI